MNKTTDTNQNATPPVNSEAVRCGEWLGEMEAALALLDSAGRKLWNAKEYGVIWQLGEAITLLEKAIATKPRHSPSDPSSAKAKHE